jgi:hypothetical protein
MRVVAVIAFLFLAAPALAQSVQQSGNVTNGHIATWATTGVIQDGGSVTANDSLSGGSTSSLSAGTTEYCATAGCASSAAIASTVPFTGTTTNLNVAVAAAPGTGHTVIATLYTGVYGSLASTALTCTISGSATSCSDATHQINIVAGTAWAIQLVVSSGATSTSGETFGFQFISSVPAPIASQSVLQSGNITSGHVPIWVTNGVIGDSGNIFGVIGGPSTSVIGDAACWNSTNGTLLSDCGGQSPQTIASVAHEWLNSYTASTGVFTQSQPGFSDLTGVVSLGQGGLGGSQSAATVNEIPVYPGSSGAAVPTFIITAINTGCSYLSSACVTLFGYANPVWWGADPTGTNDSTSAFNSAAAAFGTTGGSIAFPAGKFKFLSQPTITFPASRYSVTITGAGQDVTVLYWPNSSGGLPLSFPSCLDSIHIRDLTFSTGATNGGTAVSMAQTVNNCATYVQNDFFRVTFRGDDGGDATDYWTKGVSISAITGVNFDTALFWGSSGALGQGISIVGTGASAYSTLINIDKSAFLYNSIGVVYGSYVQGVNVNLSTFNYDAVGISVPGSESGTLSQLFVSNSEFNTTSNAIQLLTAVFNFQAVNNNFGFIPASSYGIDIAIQDPFLIANNWFEGTNTTSNAGIILAAPGFTGGYGTIIGNIFDNLDFGLDFNNATNVAAIGNEFTSSVTAPIPNTATGDILVNNVGYNPVGVTGSLTVGTSPATICAGASPETHYYIQSATNTATVKLTNTSGPQIGEMTSTTLPVIVNLGPNECDYITWTTTAPTYTKSVH